MSHSANVEVEFKGDVKAVAKDVVKNITQKIARDLEKGAKEAVVAIGKIITGNQTIHEAIVNITGNIRETKGNIENDVAGAITDEGANIAQELVSDTVNAALNHLNHSNTTPQQEL